jgi:hypothetical protein
MAENKPINNIVSQSKFYFEDYYNRRLDLYTKLKSAPEKRRKFHKSIRITTIENNSKQLTSLKIFKSLKESYGIDTSVIESIYQYENSKTFIVKFKDQTDDLIIKNIINDKKDETLRIVDPNEISHNINVSIKAVLRFHWLPHDMNKEKIKEYLTKNIKVGDVSKEKFKEPDMAQIENGVIRIKIEYDITYHNTFLELIGLKKIDNQRCLIQLCGVPPKCLICDNSSHKVAVCPKKNLFCTKCNKKYHTIENCVMSNILKETINVDAEPENFEENEPSKNNSNTNNIQNNNNSTQISNSNNIDENPQKPIIKTDKTTENIEQKNNKSCKRSDRSSMDSNEEGDMQMQKQLKFALNKSTEFDTSGEEYDIKNDNEKSYIEETPHKVND